MKNLPIIIGITALLAIAWAYFTGRISFSKSSGTAPEKLITTDSSVSKETTTPAEVKSSVTTIKDNPAGTGTALRFSPTKVGKTNKITVAVNNGISTTLASGVNVSLYGTDGNGKFITSKGLIPEADVRITGVLYVNTTTAAAAPSTPLSDFNLKVQSKSSFQR